MIYLLKKPRGQACHDLLDLQTRSRQTPWLLKETAEMNIRNQLLVSILSTSYQNITAITKKQQER